MLAQVLAELKGLHLVDYSGLIFGILYVFFATKEKPICWVFGALSSLSIAYAGVFLYKLYSDATLNIIYFLMAIWGIWSWTRSGKQSTVLDISKMNSKNHLVYIGLSILLAMPLALFFSKFPSTSYLWLDAITTAFAIGATILTIFKKLESWIYWILIDLVYIGIYFSLGAYLFALLFVIYIILAIQGFISWKRTYSGNLNLEQV